MSNGEGNSNGAVKWKEVIPVLLAIFSITVAIAMGALLIHSQSPHKDAVSRSEFNQFTGSVNSNFKRVIDRLDRIVENE